MLWTKGSDESANFEIFDCSHENQPNSLDFSLVVWKFTKFFMSYFKPQVSFSLNFASLFNVMRNNSSVLSWLKLYMIFTKGAHQSAKFQIFDCSGEISPNLYFDRLLLLKVYKISGKKVQSSYLPWYWRVVQNLKKNRFVVSKMTRIWWILIRALKYLKRFHFGPFRAKYITFDLKKYWGYIFHDNEERCKIWRKTDLWFGKWHEEFGKFSLVSKWSVKIGTLMVSFCPKQKMHELKSYRGVVCNDTEEWWKIWRGIDLLFQN